MKKSDFYDYACKELQVVIQNQISLTKQEMLVRRLIREGIKTDPEMVPRLHSILQVIKHQQEAA